ncbi:MAG TPA: amino acid permease [Alphaproteobacteria bacterium]
MSGTPAAGGAAGPRPLLSVLDTVAIVVGIVVGAGIFKMPSLVAAQAAGSAGHVILAWVVGGAVSLIGALCYAELASAFPNAGGEYHFLTRAYGRSLGFLFAWARMVIIQTGSIALLAYVFGDYAASVLPLGPEGPAIFAVLAVAALTGLNLAGLRHSATTQDLLVCVTITGLLAIVVVGFSLESAPAAPAAQAGGESPAGFSASGFGLAMVFVLLTYGGWNEAAYISAELRDVRRNMARALVLSIGIITALYLAVNLAYIHALGVDGMARTEAVASDLMRAALGGGGALFVSALVALVALTSINVTIITGARTNYALAQDFALFGFLGRWNARTGTPTSALWLQGGIAIVLILYAAVDRRGFETVVEYISPAFWSFMLLTGLSLFVLRRRDPDAPRPFRVPLYPLTPALLCLSAGYLLYSSIVYTGEGALVGLAVLLSGIPLLLVARRPRRRPASG